MVTISADERGSGDGRRVDGDLVGPGSRQMPSTVGHAAHAAADGEGDEDLVRGAAYDVVVIYYGRQSEAVIGKEGQRHWRLQRHN